MPSPWRFRRRLGDGGVGRRLARDHEGIAAERGGQLIAADDAVEVLRPEQQPAEKIEKQVVGSRAIEAEDGIRDADVTGVQTCALPICLSLMR